VIEVLESAAGEHGSVPAVIADDGSTTYGELYAGLRPVGGRSHLVGGARTPLAGSHEHRLAFQHVPTSRLRTTRSTPSTSPQASFSGDGLELFFDRSPDGHIFVARRSTTTEPFGPPALVDLGDDGCCDGFPDISSDSLALYLCSSR